MALSFLKYESTDDRDAIFTADIGSNRVFSYRIGTGATVVDDQELLDAIHYVSPVHHIEQIDPFNSSFELRIPLVNIEPRFRYVQLVSYRSLAKDGPAWSMVCQIWVPSLSNIHSSLNGTMSMIHTTSAFKPARSVPFSIAESRFSAPMFLGQLLEIAKLLVPSSSDYLSGLIQQNSPLNITPDAFQRIIIGVLDALKNDGISQQQRLSSKAMTKEQAIRIVEGLSRNSVKSMSLSRSAGYSRSMDAGLLSGPLLAGLISSLGPSVLKAVGPLFQNAPQMLQAILENPIKLLNAVSQADFAQQQLNEERIKSMLSQGNQALLMHLLMDSGTIPIGSGLGLTPSSLLHTQSLAHMNPLKTKSDQRVRLRFKWPENNGIGPVYKQGVKWTFYLQPYSEHTTPSRPISKTRVKLQIKLIDSVLLEKTFIFSNVLLSDELQLDLMAYEVVNFPTQTNLMAVAEFSWQGKNGEVITAGNRGLYDFRVSGELFIRSIGSRHHRDIPLSDPTLYREFWHRIWEGGDAEYNRWHLDVNARYYYLIEKKGLGNARMESKFLARESGDNSSKTRIKWHGMLKSGMKLDPIELVKLLPLFGEQEWSDEEIELLVDETLEKRINQQASATLELRGRVDERGTIWVFPLIDLVNLEYNRVVDSGSDGAILSTALVTKLLPVPVSAIFVGAKLGS